MGQSAAELSNPYAPPQCAALKIRAECADLDAPIVLLGEINLAHEALVVRRLTNRAIVWLCRLGALVAVGISGLCFYRFCVSGNWSMLWLAMRPLLAAPFILFGPWIVFGAYAALVWLLKTPHRHSLAITVTSQGLRTNGAAGEVFQPWSSFSQAKLAGELVGLCGTGLHWNVPVVILNLNWCAHTSEQDRLLSVLERHFGLAAGNAKPSATATERTETAATMRPEFAAPETIVLAGWIGLDQTLRMQRLLDRSFGPRSLTVGFGVLLGLLTAGGTATLWWAAAPFKHWLAGGFQISIMWLFYLAFLFTPRLRLWALRRSFQSGRTRPKWMTWTISRDGISLISDEVETRESWQQVQHRGEQENMLVLFNPSAYRVHLLPREFATDDQWNQLRDWATAPRQQARD